MPTLISINNVTAGYDGRAQIENISLSVAEGEFLGIVGPNGGGKTTLLRVMLGLLKPMAGEVCYYKDGQRVPQISLGYLPQYSATDRHFPISVAETVLSGLLPGRLTAEKRAQAEAVMSELRLESLARRPIKALSGGELQRVLLARAMASRPDALILDEPTTYMDAASEQLMYEALAHRAPHCAVVLVSHDREELERMAERVVLVTSYELRVTSAGAFCSQGFARLVERSEKSRLTKKAQHS